MGDLSNCFFKSRRDQEGGVKAQGVTRYVLVDKAESYLFVDFLCKRSPGKLIFWADGGLSTDINVKYKQKGLSKNVICTSGDFLLENRVGWKISTLQHIKFFGDRKRR